MDSIKQSVLVATPHSHPSEGCVICTKIGIFSFLSQYTKFISVRRKKFEKAHTPSNFVFAVGGTRRISRTHISNVRGLFLVSARAALAVVLTGHNYLDFRWRLPGRTPGSLFFRRCPVTETHLIFVADPSDIFRGELFWLYVDILDWKCGAAEMWRLEIGD